MSDQSARSDLLQQLRQLGVETITAEYNGYGDSGQVDDPDFGDVEVSGDLGVSVQDLFYDLLNNLYGGWELDDGSYGHFSWNVNEDRIALVHTIQTESTEKQNL